MKKIHTKATAILFAALLPGAASAAISKADMEKYFDLGYLAKKAPVKDDKTSPMYQYAYASRVDFAKLEHERPLTQDFLRKLTPDDLLALDQEAADQLYARLSAGPIPDGVYDGKAKIMDGSAFKTIVKLFTHEEERKGILGRLMSWWTADSVAGLLDNLANTMWSGKHFFKNEKVLRNVIPENDRAGKMLGVLVKGFDYKTLTAKDVTIKGQTIKAWEIFPAKLYCGQSLMDSRRESVLIDYAYSDTVAGYQEPIDFLASRQGLYVRDEIRMVRPGLYLGKAYLNRMFFLTFVLHNPEVDKQNAGRSDWASMQECWTGTQKQGYL